MLHEFLSRNRSELIDRCKAKVMLRPARDMVDSALMHGIPQFIDQLIKTLRIEQTGDPMQSRKVSGVEGGANTTSSEIGEAATLHGRELLRHGFTVDQVVHDYGDLCQAVTELAFECHEPIDIDEFKTLNRCLDNAIADAVTEFAYGRDYVAASVDRAANERQGVFVHELRGLLNTATLAFRAIKGGGVAVNGATGTALERSLLGLSSLIERSVIDVRAAAGQFQRNELLSLAEFIADAAKDASLDATARDRVLTVAEVDPTLAIEVDRALLSSALANLLTNAFKFTFHQSKVTLQAYAAGDRILIEVSDHCGGLPAGSVEKLFRPFMQGSGDQSGMGLGLSIARRNVEANRGLLRARDVPGTGCVFTIDLPRHLLPTALEPAPVTGLAG